MRSRACSSRFSVGNDDDILRFQQPEPVQLHLYLVVLCYYIHLDFPFLLLLLLFSLYLTQSLSHKVSLTHFLCVSRYFTVLRYLRRWIHEMFDDWEHHWDKRCLALLSSLLSSIYSDSKNGYLWLSCRILLLHSFITLSQLYA